MAAMSSASTSNGESDTELSKKAREYPTLKNHFKGVFSKDTLPRLREDECAIINIEDSVDEKGHDLPGSHWVAAGRRFNQSWYMDSFGLAIPPLIKNALVGPIYHKQVQIQANDSDSCGWFALAACVCVYQSNQSVTSSLNAFYKLFERPNLEANEPILKTYLSRCHRSMSDITKLYQ